MLVLDMVCFSALSQVLTICDMCWFSFKGVASSAMFRVHLDPVKDPLNRTTPLYIDHWFSSQKGNSLPELLDFSHLGLDHFGGIQQVQTFWPIRR